MNTYTVNVRVLYVVVPVAVELQKSKMQTSFPQVPPSNSCYQRTTLVDKRTVCRTAIVAAISGPAVMYMELHQMSAFEDKL